MDRITNTELHKRAYVYHQIDKIGLLINEDKRLTLKKEVIQTRKEKLNRLSQLWNCHVYLGKDTATTGDSLNLNSPGKVLERLKKMGFNVPKVRKKDKDTGTFDFVESVEELALRRCFAEEKDPGHIEALKTILDIRELNTLYIRYINAKLYDNIFYSNYNICGAVTGRRSCRKSPFGLGGNGQTLPVHYDLGLKFVECIEPRSGNIFLSVDQIQAEDYPVSCLAENHHALEQLNSGVDRHTDLASYIFGIPKASRTIKEWKDSIERYLGKKCRHANNYGMRGQMMSDSLAKEGKNIDKANCEAMLKKVNEYDPQIDAIFHNYIKNQVFSTKMLVTPFGRERYFMGLKQHDTNYKILNEAYSYIPQSVVGDNTAFAVTHLYFDYGMIPVNEAHDSVTIEVKDDYVELKKTFDALKNVFDREITFHNGIKINIPIEAKIGYDLKNLKTLKTYTDTELQSTYHYLKKAKECQQSVSTV